MLFRGMYADALNLLATYEPRPEYPEGQVRKLAAEVVALIRQKQPALAGQTLAEADNLCRSHEYNACGGVLRAHGIIAVQNGKLAEAQKYFLDTIAFARARHDRWLEASVSVNLGWTALHTGHFDESLDWSKIARRSAADLGAEGLAQIASGNVGYAYLELGDDERALEQFLQAEKSAKDLGNPSSELNWILTAGYAYRDAGDLNRAIQSYHRAYNLAQKTGSKEDIIDALEDLAQGSVDAGKFDEADSYIGQVAPMELAGGGHLSDNIRLTQGMIAAARGQSQQAESLFRAVRDNANNPTTTRLGAGEQLARLYESEGNLRAAEQMYKSTLDFFESAQGELKSEESQIPFVANAARIYDDYIHLLLAQNRTDDALAVADRSRARTLTRSVAESQAPAAKSAIKPAAPTAALNPRQIAQKTGSTLLFYWMGQKQSCLWAVTPLKASFFPLPAHQEIVARIDRYRKAVLDDENPMRSSNQDGQALYQTLVAPAAKLIRPNAPVIILADGALSQLNFETLLAPGPSPTTEGNLTSPSNLHYWIDDATLLSAPSLAMLAVARPAANSARSLLLIGNPVSTSDDFPSLPLFGFEVKKIQTHFDPSNVAVFTREQATPAAYLGGNPARYAYIHFVSHAVSSSTAPLDSAIILSATNAGVDSYKLYARDIMRHPIDAELVTISACYGSGTRSYAGEGLVGLSWAFLHAGAHSVIGALWEASDDSSPRLMESLYQGIEDGQPPAAALRKAKLALLHSNSKFQSPFYWAPFQIYSSR
jgi:CHAT domain-containing protein